MANLKHSILKRLFPKQYGKIKPDAVIELKPHKSTKIRGRVLFSYVISSFGPKKDFLHHSNHWESYHIAKIFTEMGYVVDAINCYNSSFVPNKKYDVIFSIDAHLYKLAALMNNNPIKLLHLTGSYPQYTNSAELKRVENLEKRKNCLYFPKRIDSSSSLSYKLLELADYCSLTGNSHTLNTFPIKLRKKITRVIATASFLDRIKIHTEYVPKEKEFLWFGGLGAVHKGLDLLLEIFVKNPHLKLNIVGLVEHEKDFIKIYKKELYETENIKLHGFLTPSSKKFKEIVGKSFCFIAPSCSEGMSTAVATMLQFGLYPIISKENGIDLPKDCGIYLNNCSIDEIEEKINKVLKLTDKELKNQISKIQGFALKNYSREKFDKDIRQYLKKAVK